MLINIFAKKLKINLILAFFFKKNYLFTKLYRRNLLEKFYFAQISHSVHYVLFIYFFITKDRVVDNGQCRNKTLTYYLHLMPHAYLSFS